jgi:hypothetical protein
MSKVFRVQVKQNQGADLSKCRRMRFAPWCNRKLGLLERIPPGQYSTITGQSAMALSETRDP